MTPFLITGLPRSRTAWMAKACSVFGVSMCLHEPLRWLDRWEDVFTAIWRPRFALDFVGVSDHGFGFHLPAIMERLAPRTLIIERPIAEVEASWERVSGLPAGNFCTLLAECLAFDHPQIKRVGYADLDSTDTVLDCMAWLMPGLRVSRKEIDRLQGVNVQADIEGIIKEAVSRRDDLPKLFPADILARLA